METWKKPINIKNIAPKEVLPGILMRTLAYNEDITQCHFILKKGVSIPLHDHLFTQNGFVLKGKVNFKTLKGEFIAQSGDSYIFNRWEKHGADILEETELLETFSPTRKEYYPSDDQYLPDKTEFL